MSSIFIVLRFPVNVLILKPLFTINNRKISNEISHDFKMSRFLAKPAFSSANHRKPFGL